MFVVALQLFSELVDKEATTSSKAYDVLEAETVEKEGDATIGNVNGCSAGLDFVPSKCVDF